MANAPLHKCTSPGCRTLVRGQSRCEAHAKQKWTRGKQSQESQKLYDHRWAQASKRHRAEHPLCAECERKGRTEPAVCVDHVIPHRGNVELFWDESNWESLCRTCHQTKTLRGE